MAPRLELHEILTGITEHVYFQPPETVRLQYPCILYRRDYVRNDFADDIPYASTKRYLLTVIDRDPDSSIPVQIGILPRCSYDRFYAADGLNHDVFKLFF